MPSAESGDCGELQWLAARSAAGVRVYGAGFTAQRSRSPRLPNSSLPAPKAQGHSSSVASESSGNDDTRTAEGWDVEKLKGLGFRVYIGVNIGIILGVILG